MDWGSPSIRYTCPLTSFEGKALCRLFGEGVDTSHFNDDALVRTLDTCYVYGTTGPLATATLIGQQLECSQHHSLKQVKLACRFFEARRELEKTRKRKEISYCAG